jgi:hypothetical protein
MDGADDESACGHDALGIHPFRDLDSPLSIGERTSKIADSH